MKSIACLLLLAVLVGADGALPSNNELPHYAKPSWPNKGVLRVFGADLKGLVREWEDAYVLYNPDVRIAENPGGSDAAIGVIQHGIAEIAIFGREMELNDYLGFYEDHGYNPTEITIASGTYSVPGATWAPLIFVNKDNPIAHLTLRQLDGIFGSERTGGYEGFVWKPENGRGADRNIRTWGQLGLTGEWADKPIQTYGYAAGGMAHFFEIKVFHGGNKWNPNYRQYVENGTKILTPGRESAGVLTMLSDLEHDRYGIGWAGMPQWNQVPQIKGIKVLALASADDGPYVAPSPATLASRAYPLTRSVYIYLDKEPGRPLSPRVKDFIRFILSAEGQEIVRRHGVYYPLPGDVAAAQIAKLD